MKVFGEDYEWPEVGILYIWGFGAALNIFSGTPGGFVVGCMMITFVVEQHLGICHKNTAKLWRELSEKQSKLCEAQQEQLTALHQLLNEADRGKGDVKV